jgi:lipopolysaccharide export system permease protein
MTLVERYILRIAFGAFAATLVGLTAVIWITQALRELDLLTSKGQTVIMFFIVTGLSLPTLVTVISPVALFIAVIYTLNRLNGDSELIVMSAAGVAPTRLLRPFLTLAGFVCLLVSVMTLYILPTSFQELRELLQKIRGDFIANVVKEGQFTSLDNGITFHFRERSGSGVLLGIFMQDRRERDRPTVYLAERGQTFDLKGQSYLVLEQGSVHRQQPKSRDSSIIAFERYAIDLAAFNQEGGDTVYKPRERGTTQLLFPKEDDAYYRMQSGRFRAELHERFSGWLYPLRNDADRLRGARRRANHPSGPRACRRHRRGGRRGVAHRGLCGLERRGALADGGRVDLRGASCGHRDRRRHRTRRSAGADLRNARGPGRRGHDSAPDPRPAPPAGGVRRPMMIGATLGRYLSARFARTIAAVFLTVFALVYTLDFVELMRRAGDAEGATPAVMARLALFRTPTVAEQVLPFAVLFGSMAALLQLSRKLELVSPARPASRCGSSCSRRARGGDHRHRRRDGLQSRLGCARSSVPRASRPRCSPAATSRRRARMSAAAEERRGRRHHPGGSRRREYRDPRWRHRVHVRRNRHLPRARGAAEAVLRHGYWELKDARV